MAKAGVAIVGIGDSHIFRRGASPHSAFRMAVDAITEASDDAGVDVAEVDGFCSFGLHGPMVAGLVDALGTKDFRFGGSALQLGGAGMLGALSVAIGAIESRQASYVALFKSLHSGQFRMSDAGGYLPTGSYVDYRPGYEESHYGGPFAAPYGIYVPYEGFALHAQRYLHDTTTSEDDLANVAMAIREHATTNPRARFYCKPLPREEYLQAPMLADPLRRFDVCLENDFGVAFLVTSVERARDLKRVPVRIGALSYAVGYLGNHGLFGDHRYPTSFLTTAAERLWRESDYKLADMKTAQLFDMTTVSILMQLEDIGFCALGGAATFVADGGLSLGRSRIPINTNGGQLSASYAIGMTVFAEAVRQVRGDAANQVGFPALMAHSPYSAPAGLVILDR
jgi:acetyl-CoA acetyltransferase